MKLDVRYNCIEQWRKRRHFLSRVKMLCLPGSVDYKPYAHDKCTFSRVRSPLIDTKKQEMSV